MGLIILCKLKNIQSVATLYFISVSLLSVAKGELDPGHAVTIFCQKYFNEIKLYIFIYI